jgi:hypothetical protein
LFDVASEKTADPNTSFTPLSLRVKFKVVPIDVPADTTEGLPDGLAGVSTVTGSVSSTPGPLYETEDADHAEALLAFVLLDQKDDPPVVPGSLLDELVLSCKHL